MAKKIFSLKMFAIAALFSSQLSTNLVQGVVRVDLERKYITHNYDNVQLDDRMDSDLFIDSPIQVEEEVQIGNEEMNYSELREIQRRHTSR